MTISKSRVKGLTTSIVSKEPMSALTRPVLQIRDIMVRCIKDIDKNKQANTRSFCKANSRIVVENIQRTYQRRGC